MLRNDVFTNTNNNLTHFPSWGRDEQIHGMDYKGNKFNSFSSMWGPGLKNGAPYCLGGGTLHVSRNVITITVLWAYLVPKNRQNAFTARILFDHHNHQLLFPIYTSRDQGPERLSDLPRVKQLLRIGARAKMQVFTWFSTLYIASRCAAWFLK
jgi:hypothetical protein